tara:strand:- start:369 stop:650 length:282 start_codon:yes stop_codon:yes gene_type:complete
MIKISDYIFNEEDEEEISELESMGYRSYAADDGSAYMVDPSAPEEADHLASAAAQGDPEAIDEITGYKNPFETKSSKSDIGSSDMIQKAASIK